jgi:hypothetical protein
MTKTTVTTNTGGARALALLAVATLAVAAALPALAATTASPGAHAKTAARSAATNRTVTAAPAPDSARASNAGASGGDMVLHGGEDGTVFRTLTVEGEDRIHIEVERPTLALDLDPESAPGLDWGSALDVLDRTTPDALAPLLDVTSREASPFVARPWLSHFTAGPVARFRPDMKGVARWKLTVVDERGETAALFGGNGDPPAEIAWNGRTANGGSVQPGVTYSYVFEAHDRAGNRRNFVGEGFRVPTFRYDAAEGPVLVFTGAELRGAKDETPVAAPPIVLETATALNQVAGATRRVRVEVTARGLEEANATAQRLNRWLAPLLIGDPARLDCVALTRPDAPAGGSIRIAAVR